MAYSPVVGTAKVLETKKLTSSKNPDWVGYTHRCESTLSPVPVWLLSTEGEIPVGTVCNIVCNINNFNSVRGVVIVPVISEF